MFYQNIDVLKKFISEVGNYYKNKAVGMKLYTEVESRVEDFTSIDFDVGGVHGSITEDSMYIDWLVVDEEYKGNGIGKNLMCKIEEKAKDLNVYSIDLGTVEFQAVKFYEKLGYKTVFVKENDPRGYKSYSMVKKI